MGIIKKFYGKTQMGYEVYEYTLSNSGGMEVSILDFGCVITKIAVPDKRGKIENIVLKLPSIRDYETNPAYIGCIVGPYAGRIKGGLISIGDVEYHLDKNDGVNALHGGFVGLGRVMWKALELLEKPYPQIKLTYLSPHGEGGFPGNLRVNVVYSLCENNSLQISYEAVSDKKTAISLTNHSYFNLSGTLEPITKHSLRVVNPKILELDTDLLVTGKVIDLNEIGIKGENTVAVREYMDILQKVTPFYGIDHPFLIENDGENLVLAAEYSHSETGRFMEVYSNLPYMNIYSGNFLNGMVLEGATQYSGICFETQEQPDGPNIPELGYSFLDANTPYSCTTVFKFTIDKNS